MKRVVVFTEINSDNSYNTAVRFSLLEEWEVYALHKNGERTVECEGITLLKIEERRRGELEQAMEQIAQTEGKIDLLVLSAGRHCVSDGRITEGHDYNELLDVVEENVTGNLEVVHAASGLLKNGTDRRVALLTERGASINLTAEEQGYGYHMSLAALNMMMKVLFNTMRKEGFTFRCFACDNMETKGVHAVNYLQMDFSDDPNDAYIHSEENRIVMRDSLLCELPW